MRRLLEGVLRRWLGPAGDEAILGIIDYPIDA